VAFHFFTVFLVTAVVTFLAVYGTPFVPVVTLGGTVLGASLTGLAAALLGLFAHRIQPRRWGRAALELLGLAFVLTDTARFLPGWRLTPGMGTMVFLTVLCLLLTALTEWLYPEPPEDSLRPSQNKSKNKSK
jgi:membrane-bound ClpP family serine protease